MHVAQPGNPKQKTKKSHRKYKSTVISVTYFLRFIAIAIPAAGHKKACLKGYTTVVLKTGTTRRVTIVPEHYKSIISIRSFETDITVIGPLVCPAFIRTQSKEIPLAFWPGEFLLELSIFVIPTDKNRGKMMPKMSFNANF